MLADTDTVRWTSDPAWPWSLPHLGLPALVVVGIVLAVLTVWTYLGVRSATFRRVAVVLALRLFALLLACLMLVRPSLALLREQHPPSTMLIVVDRSASMNAPQPAVIAGRAGDRVGLVEFGGAPVVIQPPTSETATAYCQAKEYSGACSDPKTAAVNNTPAITPSERVNKG